METREIEKRDWIKVFDDFSKRHQGFSATLESMGDNIGAQQEAGTLPFVGISADDKGSEPGSIAIMLGTETEDHIEHIIPDPTHVWIKTAGDRVNDAVEIEAADGTKAILQIAATPGPQG